MAISNDPPQKRDHLVAQLGLTFHVLSDDGLALAAAFGVRQKDKDSPLPSTFVLDTAGRVAWRAVGDNIVVRPSVERMLELVRNTK